MRHYPMICALLAGFFSACSPAPPGEKERFANDIPVAEFAVPWVGERQVDFEYFKHLIDSTRLLPFEYRLDGIFFMSKDEDNLYVSMGPSLETAKNSPEQAALRKPYLGVTAFDLHSGKVKWHKHYDDPDLCTFPVEDSTFSIGYPELIDHHLIITKSNWRTREVCYNILEAKSGQLIRMEGLTKGGFPVLNLTCWLKCDDAKQQAQRLDPADGKALWTYSIPSHDPPFDNQLRVLNDGFLYYPYRQDAALLFDILEVQTGRVVHTITLSNKELKGATVELTAYENDTAYFTVHVCGRIKLDATRECVNYDVVYDGREKRITRRSGYRVGY